MAGSEVDALSVEGTNGEDAFKNVIGKKRGDMVKWILDPEVSTKRLSWRRGP